MHDADCPLTPRQLELMAVATRADATLEDVARLADESAWDSCSFVRACGIESNDVRADDLTDEDHAELARVNGGRAFTYDLSHWST